MDSVPTLQKNTESGDYRVLYWPGASGSDAGLHFNQNYGQDEAGDPAIGELMRNNDFRIGLSHAVDRDKILQLVFLGAGESRQMVVPSNNPYYPGDEYAFKYTEYDTAKANEILDGVLPNKNADGFRLLDSGDVAEIEVTAVELFGTFWPQTGELVKEMWEDVGVKTKFTQNERSALRRPQGGKRAAGDDLGRRRRRAPLHGPLSDYALQQRHVDRAPHGHLVRHRGREGHRALGRLGEGDRAP